MSEQELKCNILSCRSTLSSLGKACVTTCSRNVSHPQSTFDVDFLQNDIFCVICATKAFEVALVCPACETSLTQLDDIVIVELNPSQEYRSSILSGLRPEIIMEICTRAISFWTYQTSQESKYQEMTQKAQEDKLSLLEKQMQRMTREVNAELSSFRDTVSALQKDVEQEKRKSTDLSDQLEEKSRQLSKLQTLYERQKRRPLFPDAPQSQTQRVYGMEGNAVLTNPYSLYQTMDMDLSSNPFVSNTAPGRETPPFLANTHHHGAIPSLAPAPAPAPEMHPFVYDRPTVTMQGQHRALSHVDSSLQAEVAGPLDQGAQGGSAEMREQPQSGSGGSVMNGRLRGLPVWSAGGDHRVMDAGGRGSNQAPVPLIARMLQGSSAGPFGRK